jgi:glycosyltransferase involved in cell wall biosynthesis
MSGVAVIIPTLNEAASIGSVIVAIPRSAVEEIIVVDGGSADGTQDAALAAGARVVSLNERGYGRACAAGAAAASARCDILVFLDGDGADRADLMPMLLAPIQAGTHDLVIGSRTRGQREPGAMSLHQVLAGRLAGAAMAALYGVRYTDMCAYRAIQRDALARLGMREMTYGWNLEMQMLAARAGLRVVEIPIPYQRRLGGSSKVAGSVGGSLRAGWRIIITFLRVAMAHRPQRSLM